MAIEILKASVISKISAGEVVERPASVAVSYTHLRAHET